MKFLVSALLILIVVPVQSALGQESGADRRALESTTSGLEKAEAAQNSDSQDILRGFKSYYIKSDTIYMHRETLLKELEKRGEFSAWGLSPAEDSKAADVVITITLPFLTWEWNYKMVHQPTGTELGKGKISAAVEQTAAPQLAAMIVKRIRDERTLPASFEQAQSTPQAPRNSNPEKGKSWNVRYVSGAAPGLRKDATVTLTVTHEWVTIRDSKTIVLPIPAPNLTTVDSRIEAHRATKGWEDFWDASFNTLLQDHDTVAANAAVGTADAFIFMGIIPIALIGEGILAPIKTTDHFVSMYWVEDGVAKGAEFRVSGGDAKSLLAELNKITSKTAEDLIEVSQKRLKAIAERFEASPFIETDRQVKVGWRDLAAGNYRVVVVPRERNLAEVYFFQRELPRRKCYHQRRCCSCACRIRAPKNRLRKQHCSYCFLPRPERPCHIQPD